MQTPEFIVNQEQKKGRIEQSFAGIGAAVISGGAAGGAYGFYDGLRQTVAAGMKGALKRTQVMNYTMKSGMRSLICMQLGYIQERHTLLRSERFQRPRHFGGNVQLYPHLRITVARGRRRGQVSR